MDDEQGSASKNEFVVRLSVLADPQNDKRINQFKRAINKIPETRDLRWTFDKHNRLSKDLQKEFASMNAYMKAQTSRLNPLNWFKDKRALRGLKGVYGEIQRTAVTELRKINAQVDALTDPSNAFGIDNMRALAKASEQALEEQKEKVEELKNEFDRLSNNKIELKPSVSEQFLEKSLNDVRKKMEKVNEKLETGRFTDDTNSTEMARKSIEDVKSKNREAMYMAIKHAADNGDSRKYYDMLLKDIRETRETHTQELEQAKAEFEKTEQAYKQAMQDLENAQMALDQEQEPEFIDKLKNEEIPELQAEVDKLHQSLLQLSNQKYSAQFNLELDQSRLKQAQGMWKQREHIAKGVRDMPEAQIREKYDVAVTKTHETQKRAAEDVDKNTYTTDLKTTLEQNYRALQEERAKLEERLSEAVQKTTDLKENEKSLQDVKAKLKDADKELTQQQKEHQKNLQLLQRQEEELGILLAKYQEINADLQGNPMAGEFMSKEFQKYNGQINRLQDKLKSFGGWLKTFPGRIIKRIGVNIRSQIASFINPLTNFRRAWSAWIERFDNKALANTFEVIKYNLVTAIAPLLEKCANLALKFFAALNVFTKRWAGVDLFDKSAWQLEQMKKGVGQLTASFDELHSNTENPDDFNTLFDKGLTEDQLISPEWQKRLTEWAEGLEKVFGWILDHWKELVALWAAFKISQGLWSLYKLFGGMNGILGGMSGITFGGLLSSLGIVAGAILEVKAVWDSIEWSKNWGGMLPTERYQKAQENVGTGALGGTLLGASIGFKVGGLPGAAIGALLGNGIGQAAIGTFNTVVSTWHGDRKGTQKAAQEAGKGLGKTIGTAAGAIGGAKIGAAIGTALGPGVGTAIGAVLGAAIGWAAGGGIGEAVGWIGGKLINGVTDFFRGAGDFQRLRVSAEDVANAFELAKQKTESWNTELAKLQDLEQQTSENGETLYKMVENGEKSYWGLSDAQKEVYDQYVKVLDAEKEMKEARKQSLEYAAKEQEELGKETGNFKNYIATIQDGCKQGVISYEEMADYFSQTYATLDEEGRKTFMEQLPKYMRDSVQTGAEQYITGWEKFKTGCGEFFSNFGQNMGNLLGNGIGFAVGGVPGLIISKFAPLGDLLTATKNELDELKASADDLAASTEALNEAQDAQAKLEEQLAELTKGTDINAQQLYEDVNNGTKKWWDLTDAEKEVYDKYYELQEAMKTTDECMKNNVDNLASVEYEAAKTSGNYQKFIGVLMEENQKGNLSTEEMQKKFSQAYAGMEEDARETFLENIPEDMREGVKTGAEDYLTGLEGFGARLSRKLSEFGEAIGKFAKNAWNFFQSAGNWIAGKGFKTDEQIINEQSSKNGLDFDPTKNKKIASYAVGTNYVPNDQLAYIHKGEAIIPAKYNTSSNSSTQAENKMLEQLSTLSRQVEQIGVIVNQGIKVQGEFVQRGTDLVAAVNQTNNRLSNAVLNNRAYAR